VTEIETTVTVTVYDTEAVADVRSVAVTVNVYECVPTERPVVLPLICPALESERPGGSDPLVTANVLAPDAPPLVV